jgi:hypothetical protein
MICKIKPPATRKQLHCWDRINKTNTQQCTANGPRAADVSESAHFQPKNGLGLRSVGQRAGPKCVPYCPPQASLAASSLVDRPPPTPGGTSLPSTARAPPPPSTVYPGGKLSRCAAAVARDSPMFSARRCPAAISHVLHSSARCPLRRPQAVWPIVTPATEVKSLSSNQNFAMQTWNWLRQCQGSGWFSRLPSNATWNSRPTCHKHLQKNLVLHMWEHALVAMARLPFVSFIMNYELIYTM